MIALICRLWSLVERQLSMYAFSDQSTSRDSSSAVSVAVSPMRSLRLDAEDYAFRAGAGSLVGGRLAQLQPCSRP